MQTLTLQQADRLRLLTGKEFIFIGGTPHSEKCTQAGYNPEDLKDGKIECEALINQLRRKYGHEPEETEFFILENHHDFGIYHEAAIFYSESDPDSEDYSTGEEYALNCEELPEVWDEQAKQELREKGHRSYQPAKVIQMKAA